jgi:kynurenine formamidase
MGFAEDEDPPKEWRVSRACVVVGSSISAQNIRRGTDARQTSVRSPCMQRVIDLTQPLGPDTVLWPGSAPLAARVVSRIDTDHSYARRIDTPEHAGTHLDAPSHFAPGGAHVDAIPAERLVAPAIVLDVRAECEADSDFAIGREHVEEAERRDGPIEAGSAVLALTGWERYLSDGDRYVGGAFPGFGVGAAELLIERGVVGLGIDTLGVDPGAAADYPVHHLTLPAGLWHLEGLVNLAALPPRGALLVVGALRLVAGSGTPARVFALLPE